MSLLKYIRNINLYIIFEFCVRSLSQARFIIYVIIKLSTTLFEIFYFDHNSFSDLFCFRYFKIFLQIGKLLEYQNCHNRVNRQMKTRSALPIFGRQKGRFGNVWR